jgi:hypothetical protein
VPFDAVPAASRQASDDDGTKFLCSKAELIDELESSLPSFMRGDDWCDICCALLLTTYGLQTLRLLAACGGQVQLAGRQAAMGAYRPVDLTTESTFCVVLRAAACQRLQFA